MTTPTTPAFSWITAMWPFACNCAARGVPESDGCDDHCPCFDCHTQVHAQAVEGLACCMAYGGNEDDDTLS